jgi:phosphohistidine phosphatase
MSTLRLILTRHAKSSWDDPTVADHDRPLNARGIRAAGLIGGWLASRGDVPGEVLCSDAARTRETWERIAPHLGGEPVVTMKPALYHAGPDVMLAVLRHATAPVVMMLGHNPGIAEFAARLLAQAPADPDFHRYPSGATMVATFDRPGWDLVGFGSGALLDFAAPRNLE